MKVLEISPAVRGFYFYKDIWKPSIGDKLACEREFDNAFDKFAIKVVNNGETVGHASSRRQRGTVLTLFWCFGDDSWSAAYTPVFTVYNPEEACTAEVVHAIKNIEKALTQQNCVQSSTVEDLVN